MEKTHEIPTQDVDISEEPPMHPQQMSAFVNHFILSTCSFLNEFAGQCEEKFIILERKMQKLEAALIIVEAKIASIQHTENIEKCISDGPVVGVEVERTEPAEKPTAAASECSNDETILETAAAANSHAKETADEPSTTICSGVRACDDVRYKKFFKMLQFGVPMEAVEIKMKIDGAPVEILKTPNLILPDGVSS